MKTVREFLVLHPDASPCHGCGVVMIGGPVWRRVWHRGGFTRRMADKSPVRMEFTDHVCTVSYSAAFDFERLGWQEACRLAWEDALSQKADSLERWKDK